MRTRIWAIIAILGGAFLILWSAYMHPAPVEVGSSSYWTFVASSVCEVFGASFLVVGVMNILIETKDWRDYFGSRLREIVLERTYIQSLDANTLKDMQLSIARSLYRGAVLDQEGSFYNYLQTRLAKFVAEPFREDVICDISYTSEADRFWLCRDNVSYTCRSNGRQIQTSINWRPTSEGEFQAVRSLRIEVRPPFFVEDGRAAETLYDERDLKLTDDATSGIIVDLAKFANMDRLKVTITAEYVVDAERFQAWAMAHPTKNFSISILYPRKFKLLVEPMVLDAASLEQNLGTPGYARIKYDSWMLPTSGLVWRLTRRTDASSQSPSSE